MARDTYCSHCGTAYGGLAGYPRTCPGCGREVWANPIPVVVVLLPVEKDGRTGLVVVRRTIEPAKGRFSLVGGFLEEHESWQEGAAREVREESGVSLDPAALVPFWYASNEPRPNMVLLFSVAPLMSAADLVPFEPNAESSERGLIFGPHGIEELIEFPLHREAIRRWFSERGVMGHHAYMAL